MFRRRVEMCMPDIVGRNDRFDGPQSAVITAPNVYRETVNRQGVNTRLTELNVTYFTVVLPGTPARPAAQFNYAPDTHCTIRGAGQQIVVVNLKVSRFVCPGRGDSGAPGSVNPP